MLKALLREVRRSLAGGQRPNEVAAAIDPHTSRQQRFAIAASQERMLLLGELQAWLAQQPDDLVGWTLLGDWQLQIGSAPAAIEAYRRALRIKPLHGRAHEGLGLALLQSGQLEEAYLRLEAASKLDPSNAEIWIHWGLVDLELGNLDQAAGKFQRAVERNPGNAHGWHNLALVALKQGAVARSLEHFQRAIDLKPDHGLAYSNLALALLQTEQVDAAMQAAQRATELKKDNARVWVVLADIQIAAGAFDAAESSLLRARAIDARHVGTYIALAKLHSSRRAYANARGAFEQALAIDPLNAEAQAGLGQLTLLLGDWAVGWDLYEARRRTASTPVRNFPYLEWQSEDAADHVVLVHAEQGLGDIILFASCLHDLLQRCGHCVVEVPRRLQGLFARSFPAATVIGHEPADNVLGWLNQTPTIDRQVPIGSLPRRFRRRAKDFPVRNAYLRADAHQVAEWHSRLAPDNQPVIGIAWRGGLAMTAKHQRSLPLMQLLQALRGCGARLVNLQYGDVAEELREASQACALDVHDGVSGFGDVDQLAALTRACDGVVTVCSTQAHLTGALGVPGLVLVPTNANWRYGAQGDSMPWYPSLTLARQAGDQDWSAPLQAAADWAGQVVESRRNRHASTA